MLRMCSEAVLHSNWNVSCEQLRSHRQCPHATRQSTLKDGVCVQANLVMCKAHLGGLVGVGAGNVLGHLVAHVLVVRGMVLLGAGDVALDLLASGLSRLLVIERAGHGLLQVVARILVAVAVAIGAGQVVLQACQCTFNTLYPGKLHRLDQT